MKKRIGSPLGSFGDVAFGWFEQQGDQLEDNLRRNSNLCEVHAQGKPNLDFASE